MLIFIWQVTFFVLALPLEEQHLWIMLRKQEFKFMYRSLLISLVFCLHQPLVVAQEVWPGDVNNNGLVNGVDLLYWGLANGTSGPARPAQSTDWSAQTAGTPWVQSFPSGINYAFADCNGDGVIDEADADNAVEENFGLTHGALSPDGFTNAAPGEGPRLRMVPSATLVEEGAIVNISLFLDDTNGAVDNFYGMALKMSYTTGLIQDSGLDFDLIEDGWLETSEDNAREFFFEENDNGLAELAVTRTNQLPVAVEAEAIGQFQIIVEDIIVGLEVDTFVLGIDSVLILGLDFVPIAAVPDTVMIIVAKDTSKLTSSVERLNPGELEDEIKIFPNPVRSDFQLSSPYPVLQIRLIDPMGRSTYLPSLLSVRGGNQRVPLPPKLPPGIYSLQLRTSAGVCLKKIMLTR